MSTATTSLDRSARSASSAARGLSAVLFACVLLAVLAPRGTAVYLPLLAIGGLVALAYLDGGRGIPLPNDLVSAAFLALAGYCAINALWSLRPGIAEIKVATLAAGILIAGFMARVIERQTDSDLIYLARALAIATMLGVVYLLIEVLSERTLWLSACRAVSALCPSRKHIIVEQDVVQSINWYNLKRNVGALNLLLWPGLLAIASWPAGRVRMALVSWLAYALALAATLRSGHETSAIAIGFSSAVFAVTWYAPRVGRVATIAGWSAAVLLVVPIALLSFSAGLYCSPRIPLTGQARIVLWGYTAHEVLKSPILGVGVNSTPAIDQEVRQLAKPPEPCAPYPARTGEHSHNIYMQTWFELGLVGVLLLFAAGVVAWRALCRLPTDVQPFAFATATSAMSIAAFSWGMWQAWYQYLFALAAIALIVATRWATRRPANT